MSRVPAHLSAAVLYALEGESICIVATDLNELESSAEIIRKLRSQPTRSRASSWPT